MKIGKKILIFLLVFCVCFLQNPVLFIPVSNEPSAVLARAFGECREGQIPRPLGCFKIDAPLLAAGYLTLANENTTSQIIQLYQEYQERFNAIKKVEEIQNHGFRIIEDQIFPVLLGSFGKEEVTFVPAMEPKYQRLVLFLADAEGNILYKTNQLETNYIVCGELKQLTESIAAVSFQDINRDGLTDIVLITTCVNETGDYAGKPYKVGDVLFQSKKSFYRDWRISDKINRFSMNKSVDFITAYVRDGKSTEILYTAVTLEELLNNRFQIITEQCYSRNFEKLGRLKVVPGMLRIAEYNVFMIYLVNEQGYIVWSFQPMKDYDNLYSLKGITGRDIDGDGMKDLVVLARYSYEGQEGELMVDTKCDIYYQRTGGFEEDNGFQKQYQCTEEDTLEDLVPIIRNYWGWAIEEYTEGAKLLEGQKKND